MQYVDCILYIARRSCDFVLAFDWRALYLIFIGARLHGRRDTGSIHVHGRPDPFSLFALELELEGVA